MRRSAICFLLSAALAPAAHAQTATPANYVIAPGSSTNLTLSGAAGQQFAVIASTSNVGFSYAGTALAVGTDVAIIAIGALDGSGTAVVPVTPPFPQRDRFYYQAVFTSNGFATITPSGGVTLVNGQEARIYMPIGGAVFAAGTVTATTPGVTVTRNSVGNYTVSHVGFFQLPTPIPLVTPTGGATVQSIQFGSGQFTVQLSADANFTFAVIPVRR